MASQGGARRKAPSASDLLASRRGPKSHVPWREAYKKRCLEQLKKRRFEMLFRHGLASELHGDVEEDLDTEEAADGSTLSFGGPLQRQSSLPRLNNDDPMASHGSCSSGGRDGATNEVCMDDGRRPVALATRDMVCQVMSSEWSNRQGDVDLPSVPANQLPFMPSYEPSQHTCPDVNELCTLMDELEEEMRAEEAAILARYGERQAMGDKDLCSALENMSTEDLLCPICSKGFLFQNLSVIFCQCGMRIDTEQDGVNLQFLRKQLSAVADEHGANCSAKPSFVLQSLDGRADVQNLLLVCERCDTFSIVL